VPADVAHEVIHGRGGRTFRRALRRGSRAAETLGHVLRGEMALVGPRPRTPSEVATREDLRLLYDLARPGATGPWRMESGEDLGVEEEISLALSYLQNRTPWEDLKILLRSLGPPKTP
jgi:lipopolysaccharide/colanic/teichoic acid biosynthesis glycosyltransferase